MAGPVFQKIELPEVPSRVPSKTTPASEAMKDEDPLDEDMPGGAAPSRDDHVKVGLGRGGGVTLQPRRGFFAKWPWVITYASILGG